MCVCIWEREERRCVYVGKRGEEMCVCGKVRRGKVCVCLCVRERRSVFAPCCMKSLPQTEVSSFSLKPEHGEQSGVSWNRPLGMISDIKAKSEREHIDQDNAP